MISEDSIKNLFELKNDLQNLNWVHNVITLLDIPLLDATDDSLVDTNSKF